MVEQRHMGAQVVPLAGEMGLAQPVQPELTGLVQPQAEDQRGPDAGSVARWLALTRVTLPAMAAAHRWPIRLDHCFQRVMLDNAAGGVWHRTIARPAIRHAPPALFARAIALAEGVVREPAGLAKLNRRSLAWRGKSEV